MGTECLPVSGDTVISRKLIIQRVFSILNRFRYPRTNLVACGMSVPGKKTIASDKASAFELVRGSRVGNPAKPPFHACWQENNYGKLLFAVAL